MSKTGTPVYNPDEVSQIKPNNSGFFGAAIRNITFLNAFSHLYKRPCPSHSPSVFHTPIDFLRNGINFDRIATGT